MSDCAAHLDEAIDDFLRDPEHDLAVEFGDVVMQAQARRRIAADERTLFDQDRFRAASRSSSSSAASGSAAQSIVRNG